MIILDRIYEYTCNAIEMGERGLMGKKLLLAELRSIRNLIEPFIKEGKKEEVKRKAQSLVEAIEARSGK